MLPFTLETAAQEPEAFAAEQLAGADVVVAGEDFRFGRRRRGDPTLLRELGYDVQPVPPLAGVSSSEIRRLHPRRRSRRRGGAAGAAVRARRHRRPRRPARGDARLPDRQPRPRSGAAHPALRDLRRRGPPTASAALSSGDLDRHESALRRQRAADRAAPARLRGRPLRPAARGRGLGASPRRAGLRERIRAGRADRPRRRADPRRRSARVSSVRGDGQRARFAADPRPRPSARRG